MKTIVFTESADRAFDRLPHDLQERFLEALFLYAARQQGDVKRLTDFGGALRLRVGEYRVVCREEERRLVVAIFAHRSHVYR